MRAPTYKFDATAYELSSEESEEDEDELSSDDDGTGNGAGEDPAIERNARRLTSNATQRRYLALLIKMLRLEKPVVTAQMVDFLRSDAVCRLLIGVVVGRGGGGSGCDASSLTLDCALSAAAAAAQLPQRGGAAAHGVRSAGERDDLILAWRAANLIGGSHGSGEALEGLVREKATTIVDALLGAFSSTSRASFHHVRVVLLALLKKHTDSMLAALAARPSRIFGAMLAFVHHAAVSDVFIDLAVLPPAPPKPTPRGNKVFPYRSAPAARAKLWLALADVDFLNHLVARASSPSGAFPADHVRAVAEAFVELVRRLLHWAQQDGAAIALLQTLVVPVKENAASKANPGGVPELLFARQAGPGSTTTRPLSPFVSEKSGRERARWATEMLLAVLSVHSAPPKVRATQQLRDRTVRLNEIGSALAQQTVVVLPRVLSVALHGRVLRSRSRGASSASATFAAMSSARVDCTQLAALRCVSSLLRAAAVQEANDDVARAARVECVFDTMCAPLRAEAGTRASPLCAWHSLADWFVRGAHNDLYEATFLELFAIAVHSAHDGSLRLLLSSAGEDVNVAPIQARGRMKPMRGCALIDRAAAALGGGGIDNKVVAPPHRSRADAVHALVLLNVLSVALEESAPVHAPLAATLAAHGGWCRAAPLLALGEAALAAAAVEPLRGVSPNADELLNRARARAALSTPLLYSTTTTQGGNTR